MESDCLPGENMSVDGGKGWRSSTLDRVVIPDDPERLEREMENARRQRESKRKLRGRSSQLVGLEEKLNQSD